jgi:hypothetical protein
MRCAVIFYHKNIDKIYRPEWIEQCIESVRQQTYQDFDVLEVDYGVSENGKRYCNGLGKNNFFFSLEGDNHIAAMNFLIELGFNSKMQVYKSIESDEPPRTVGPYDVIFNTNMDDVYHPLRFEKQLKAIKDGYQLVSSNFAYINHAGDLLKSMNMVRCGSIGKNLRRNHNVIAHPCVAMHRSFWDDDLHYNNLLGYEDLDLWQRAFIRGKKFFIVDEFLMWYRLHEKQVTKKHKAK